jgi:drug/metabolite transporter (DMT)-like permease
MPSNPEVELIDRQVANIRLELIVYLVLTLLLIAATVFLFWHKDTSAAPSALIAATKPILSTLLSGVTVHRVFAKRAQVSSMLYFRGKLVVFDSLSPDDKSDLVSRLRALVDQGVLGKDAA